MNKETAGDAWDRFLNPESLKNNILGASVYIVAFEILKDSIIEKIKGFYAVDFNNLQPVETDRYCEEVLSLNRSPLYASMLWLKEQGAIDEDDFDRFDAIKTLRNRLAHEMMEFLAGDGTDYPAQPFEDMVQLLRKIEMWWFQHVEMAIDPEAFPEDLDLNEVIPGRVFSLRLLIKTALGPHEDALAFYEEYNTQRQRK